MAFSTQALRAVESLAASLGLPLVPASDGSYSFMFEQSGRLSLTSAAAGDRTVVSLSMRPHRLDEEVEQRLLALAGPDITSNRLLSTGVTRDGSVIFAVSVDDGEMSLPMLETCMQQL